MVQPETEEREEEETTEVEYQNGSSLGQWPIQGQDKPLCPYRGLGQRIPSFRSHISRILLSYFTRCPLPALSFPRVFHTLPPSATSARLSFFALSLFGTVQLRSTFSIPLQPPSIVRCSSRNRSVGFDRSMCTAPGISVFRRSAVYTRIIRIYVLRVNAIYTRTYTCSFKWKSNHLRSNTDRFYSILRDARDTYRVRTRKREEKITRVDR